MNQMQQMCETGRKCKAEYDHRERAGQWTSDLPTSALDKDGKPTTKRAAQLKAAWYVGFAGGTIPRGARLQASCHGAGKHSVQVFVGSKLVGDYNI